MSKKIIAVLLTLVIIALSACSSSGGKYNSDSASGGNAMGADGESWAKNSGYADGSPQEPKYETGETPAERKVIQNASLEIEADDATGLYSNLASRCAEAGGYEYACDIQHYESYSVIRATLKIPPGELRAFISFAGEQGRLINSKINSDDITESYYDAEIRLQTKRASLEVYYGLLKNAASVNEIISIQRTIDNITEEIEALEGKLRLWDNLTEHATVSIYIRQNNDPVKLKREIDWSMLTFEDMGYLIKNGLVTVLNTAANIIQWILIALAVCSPVLAVIAVVLIILRVRKRARNRKQSGSESENNN